MDPDTGRFFEIDDGDSPKKGTIKTYVAKGKGWPVFEIGEEIIIKDSPFEVLHIKRSSGRMILRPIPICICNEPGICGKYHGKDR